MYFWINREKTKGERDSVRVIGNWYMEKTRALLCIPCHHTVGVFAAVQFGELRVDLFSRDISARQDAYRS
jgi:hypothetical protein